MAHIRVLTSVHVSYETPTTGTERRSLMVKYETFPVSNKKATPHLTPSSIPSHQTLLKWRVGDASLYQMALFLSMLGLFSTVVLWPVVVTLHLTGAEVLQDIPWTYLCASSAAGLVFNFSINVGIAYTFPLFISLGTILGIPLNAVVDAVFRHVNFLNWKFPATDLIVGGFLLMLVPPSDSVYIHKKAADIATCKCCR